MASRRRSSTRYLGLLALVGLAVGLGALFVFSRGGLPWRFSLPWHDMEAALASQAITATTVAIALEPGEGRIEGEATLALARPGGDGSQAILLLNPGLRVTSAAWEGAAVSWRREGERLLVQLPSEATAGSLTLAYGGVLQAANQAPLVTTPDLFIASKLQFWYPVDLKSFTEFEASVQLPEGIDVVWSGARQEGGAPAGEEAGRQTVHWAESRPVLAAGLAAGRFDRHSRIQGGIRCNVFGRDLPSGDVDLWLAALGDSYNFFNARYGPDGFDQINLLVTGDVDGTHHIGGPAIVASPAALAEPDRAFAVLASHVARNWWGETVTGRWFSTRPEAGEWLVSGLSEYAAWQAMRNVKGRRAYLQYMEQLYYPPGAPVPMKTINLAHRLRPGVRYDPRLLDVRGPYAAAAIAQYVGQDAFERACRNFMAVHRHTSVSYAALLHELTLASERPLDELVRVWFDRPGTFDYAIASANAGEGSVHVTIENRGDIPAYVPLELGIVTAGGYAVHTVDPGVHGDAVRFPLDGAFDRVVLDPEFKLGDMKRANNVWPPTQWPQALDVSRNGRIALLARDEWGASAPRRLYVFSLVDKSAAYGIAAGGVAPGQFRWDPDGQQLAVQGDSAGVWRQEQWLPGDSGAVFLGWSGAQPVYWRNGAIGGDTGEALPEPRPGLSAVHPDSGAVAYFSAGGALLHWDPETGRFTTLREDGARPVGALRWRGGERELIYFDAGGTLVALDAETGAELTLLERNYRIDQVRISNAGRRVAWVDPAGLLRAFTPGGGDPVYISLPGEVVDFAWEGEDALIAIVATVPRRLPMRFHAEYTLWRIPASTWNGVQLPYDPAQFAASTGDIDVYRPE